MSLATLRAGVLQTVIRSLDRLPHTHPPARPEHLETGRRGELAAFFYLRRRGYTVVARDWQSPKMRGDIDLIAWDGDILCFVEVKTRTTRGLATAEAAVDDHKRRTLRRLAAHYLRHQPDGTLCRFDILSVYLDGAAGNSARHGADCEHFPAAFTLS
ncbi:MAG TPA: YraN family protein [Acidobacteriaceae bacterium]